MSVKPDKKGTESKDITDIFSPISRDKKVSLFGFHIEDKDGKIRSKMRQIALEIARKQNEVVDKIFEIDHFNSFTVVPRILRKKLLLRKLFKLIVSFAEEAFCSVDRVDVEGFFEKDFDIAEKVRKRMESLGDRKDRFFDVLALYNPFDSDEDSDEDEGSSKDILNDIQKILGGYIKYNSKFFRGEFLDRNGSSLKFKKSDLSALVEDGKEIFNSIKSGNTSSIEIDDATGKLASQVISVTFEFIFDSVFEVPFYCREIADAKKNIPQATKDLEAIKTQILDIENNPPGNGFDKRQWEIQLRELDIKYYNRNKVVNSLVKISSLNVPESFETFAEAYTCYSARVIDQPIWKISLDNSDEPSDDYSVLVGELTSQLSMKAAASVKSAVGSAVKGLWNFSLNNEALTEIIATAAGMIAKKISEKFVFEVACAIIKDKEILDIQFEVFGHAITKKKLLEELEKSYC